MGFLKRLIAAGAVAALAGLVFASTAPASSHHPTGEFEVFDECPLNRETITDCVYSVTNGGSVTLGNKTVPIENPVILQGGFEGAGEEVKFFGAENGDTLSKTPQPVPGGLVGITAPAWWPKFVRDWFNKLISEGFTGVNSIVELAEPATAIKLSTQNLIEATGTALGLPVKVKLENAILGNNCYIGSNTEPMRLELTSGTSGSLEGYFGEISFNPEFTLITDTGVRLVDNLFKAPAAKGCGGLFSVFVDPLVNEILGTPSGSGKNAATLEADLLDGAAFAVRESE
jgi:hypothetical protein